MRGARGVDEDVLSSAGPLPEFVFSVFLATSGLVLGLTILSSILSMTRFGERGVVVGDLGGLLVDFKQIGGVDDLFLVILVLTQNQ